MTAGTTDRTVGEALERFTLITGAGAEDRNEACAMTALAWVAGEAWTDRPACAHRILATWVITANDHADTTAAERAELVRAGETGVLDTWWVPAEVLLGCWAKAEGERRVEKVLDVVRRVAEWKASPSKPRAYLRDADLRGAYLQGADLRDADLRGAYLRDADLRGAYLQGADLRDADLRGAYLQDADLRGAYLQDAYLRDADRPSWLPAAWRVAPEWPHLITSAAGEVA